MFLSGKFILFSQVSLPIISLHFPPVRYMLNVWLSTLIVFIIKDFARRSKVYLTSNHWTSLRTLSSVIPTCADPSGRAV